MPANINHHHRKTRAIAVAALAVGVLGLGVAFAAMSTMLQINGTANISSASWDVRWANANCSATGEATFVSPAISTTTTADDTLAITPTFKSNGDTVTCTFDAVNGGTIDAKLGTLVSSLTNLTTNDITATLTYGSGVTPAADDPLNASASQGYKLVMTYGGQPLGTAVNGITFTYQVPYVQKN
ncbi:hypothetical protein FWF93_01895 [Candidatus Saccharibacteria bacterium]|jgi:hypothetical protein|nr:hypothetical protein [Candidatus Saccharibacteria bacterium]